MLINLANRLQKLADGFDITGNILVGSELQDICDSIHMEAERLEDESEQVEEVERWEEGIPTKEGCYVVRTNTYTALGFDSFIKLRRVSGELYFTTHRSNKSNKLDLFIANDRQWLRVGDL